MGREVGEGEGEEGEWNGVSNYGEHQLHGSFQLVNMCHLRLFYHVYLLQEPRNHGELEGVQGSLREHRGSTRRVISEQ